MAMALEIKAISATNYPTLGTRETPRVCKLIDVSTCIGCKACEVACQEWNDTPMAETYLYTGSYQTMPDLAHNFWNLIKFKEAERDGNLHWTMAKYQCMHCEDPGCLRACPAPGAIVQYTNGIVDFVQENCIGCQFCVTGCPFNVPRLSPRSQKVYKCTLCSDRVSAGLEPACIKACPTGCLQFGTKRQMLEKALKRVRQLRAQGFSQASVYNPPGVSGTHAIYVLPFGNRPEDYGLPRDPSIPWVVSLWKGPMKTVGSALLLGGILAAGLHYLKFGPQRAREKKTLVSEKH
ncbi:MAG: formate dehydrogenase subunit beta [Planctomycetes bacterium]|nr:formate dehydrogenase subunit beta [Planctomycetota bacterium]